MHVHVLEFSFICTARVKQTQARAAKASDLLPSEQKDSLAASTKDLLPSEQKDSLAASLVHRALESRCKQVQPRAQLSVQPRVQLSYFLLMSL